MDKRINNVLRLILALWTATACASAETASLTIGDSFNVPCIVRKTGTDSYGNPYDIRTPCMPCTEWALNLEIWENPVRNILYRNITLSMIDENNCIFSAEVAQDWTPSCGSRIYTANILMRNATTGAFKSAPPIDIQINCPTTPTTQPPDSGGGGGLEDAPGGIQTPNDPKLETKAKEGENKIIAAADLLNDLIDHPGTFIGQRAIPWIIKEFGNALLVLFMPFILVEIAITMRARLAHTHIFPFFMAWTADHINIFKWCIENMYNILSMVLGLLVGVFGIFQLYIAKSALGVMWAMEKAAASIGATIGRALGIRQ